VPLECIVAYAVIGRERRCETARPVATRLLLRYHVAHPYGQVHRLDQSRWHPSDDDHGDLHDGTQEVKAERSGDVSRHQFGAKSKQPISTLLTLPWGHGITNTQ
jgi:hypothetical protein